MSNLAMVVAHRDMRRQVREHIRGLMRDTGASANQIAVAAETRLPTLTRVLAGKYGLRAGGAERLLSLTHEDVSPRPDFPGGTTWRIRGLMAMGHSPERIEAAAGMDTGAVDYLLKGSISAVDADTISAVGAVYTKWWDKTPPVMDAAAYEAISEAIDNNWPTPLGLDDPDSETGFLGMDAANYAPTEKWRHAEGTGTAPEITPRKEKGMTTEVDPITAQRIAGRQEASEVLAARMARGDTPAMLAELADNAGGGLLACARGESERAFAAAFTAEAHAIATEAQREADRHAEDRQEVADLQAEGQPIDVTETFPVREDWTQPHPDANLALHGWQVGPDGITQREDGRMATTGAEVTTMADVMEHLRSPVSGAAEPAGETTGEAATWGEYSDFDAVVNGAPDYEDAEAV